MKLCKKKKKVQIVEQFKNFFLMHNFKEFEVSRAAYQHESEMPLSLDGLISSSHLETII